MAYRCGNRRLAFIPSFQGIPKIMLLTALCVVSDDLCLVGIELSASNFKQDQVQIYLDVKISVSELAGSGFDID